MANFAPGLYGAIYNLNTPISFLQRMASAIEGEPTSKYVGEWNKNWKEAVQSVRNGIAALNKLRNPAASKLAAEYSRLANSALSKPNNQASQALEKFHEEKVRQYSKMSNRPDRASETDYAKRIRRYDTSINLMMRILTLITKHGSNMPPQMADLITRTFGDLHSNLPDKFGRMFLWQKYNPSMNDDLKTVLPGLIKKLQNSKKRLKKS